MHAIFISDEYLAQDHAADIVSDMTDGSLVGTNAQGNMSLDKSVLDEFRVLTVNNAVWMKGAQAWRLRDILTDDPDSREVPL